MQPPIHKTRDHVVGIRQGYITRAPLVVLAVFLCIYTRPPWAQPVRPGIRLNTGGDAPMVNRMSQGFFIVLERIV